MTDVLEAYSSNKQVPEYRRFWLQYRRFAYGKPTLDWPTTKNILDVNGIDEVAHYFRVELENLAKAPGFGQYKEPETTNLDGQYPDGSLDFLTRLIPDAREKAPNLMRFLGLLSRPACKKGNIPEEIRPPLIAMVVMFLYHMRRKKCNNIPKLFGLYCVNGGVKKSILDILSSIGLSVSYTTVQDLLKTITAVGQQRLLTLAKDPTMNKAHDNFDFSEERSGERLGEKKTFISLTNGIIFQGQYMPSEGLKQSSWHPEIPLSATVLLRTLAKEKDEIFYPVGNSSET